MPHRLRLFTTLIVLALLSGIVDAAARYYPFRGSAIVYDNATLKVSGKSVRLYGIYIPPTDRECRRNIQPTRCASRAALALDFKIQGFVYCDPQWRNQDRSFTAVCHVGKTNFKEGEDLSAYLINQGWALAAPYAPFEYHALQRIAESRGMGVWGFDVDAVTF